MDTEREACVFKPNLRFRIVPQELYKTHFKVYPRHDELLTSVWKHLSKSDNQDVYVYKNDMFSKKSAHSPGIDWLYAK